jgi:hypothetical protein
LDANSFYLLFIPGLAILTFLIGSVLATIAMGNGVDLPADDEEPEGQAAH